MFNKLQRCLTYVCSYSKQYQFYQLGAQFLAKIYSKENRKFMRTFFTEN